MRIGIRAYMRKTSKVAHDCPKEPHLRALIGATLLADEVRHLIRL
jgi:hypothetical protein